MCDADDSFVAEGMTHGLLDVVVCFCIQSCGSFIADQDTTIIAHEHASEGEELAFTQGEIGALIVNYVAWMEGIVETGGAEGVPDRAVGVGGEGVEVAAYRAGEEGGFLRYDGEGVAAEVVEGDEGDVGSVDGDGAAGDVCEAE